MSDPNDDARTTVQALLTMHGLTPAAEEVEAMVAAYSGSRQMVAALYTVPGVRYEEPALTFDPRVVAP